MLTLREITTRETLATFERKPPLFCQWQNEFFFMGIEQETP
jgi:hypothetical protein